MKTLQIIVTTLNLITKILEEKGLAQMKTPQELTVCVSLRLPITSLTEFSLLFNRLQKDENLVLVLGPRIVRSVIQAAAMHHWWESFAKAIAASTLTA